MIIGIISDTHGSIEAVERAVRAIPDADCWFHAGDYSQDADALTRLTNVPVYTARGNCDGYETEAKIDEYIDLEGRRFWLTHGHHYDVKHSIRELIYWADQYETDMVVFGHTHIPMIEKKNEKYYLNPGSARYTKTCARLTVEKDRIEAEILSLH